MAAINFLVRGLLLALFSVSLVLSQVLHYEFALQEEPVTFTQEPSSQVALVGSTVTFNCTASVRDLPVLRPDDYRLPVFSWQYNGVPLPSNVSPKWEIISSTTHTELHIRNVSLLDAGHYECVCSDGVYEDNEVEVYYAVMVSRRARLDIVSVSPETVVSEVAVNVSAGGYVVLNCNTGASRDPQEVAWRKDESILATAQISEVGVILSNNSLLIFSASEDIAGSYHCIGWYSEEPVNGTTIYEVNVFLGGTSGESAVILDAPSVLVNTGGPVELSCYVLGGDMRTVTWRKDGSLISEGSSTLVLGETDSGVYTCQISGSNVEASTTVLLPPRIRGLGQIREDVVRTFDEFRRTLELECRLESGSTSPPPSFYWYKDGENITDYFNSTTGLLRYEVSRETYNQDGNVLYGVYQCFAESSAGVGYTITRVLPYAFSNPPSNFSCHAVTRDDIDLPRVILDWWPPTLDLVSPDHSTERQYRLTYQNLMDEVVTTQSNHLEVNLDKDGIGVKFSVSTVAVPTNGAIATCVISDTFAERKRIVSELIVSCPEEMDQDIVVQWENPGVYVPPPGSDKTFYPVMDFSGTCLYTNQSEADYSVIEDDPFVYEGQSTITLATVRGTPGTASVCLFGGFYEFAFEPAAPELRFEPVACGFPSYQSAGGGVQLDVSCSDLVATVGLQSTSEVNNATVQGKCVLPTWERRFLSATPLSVGEPAIIDNLPNNTICTFAGEYEDASGQVVTFEPVQCIMGGSIAVLPLPATTEPPTTTQPPTTTDHEDSMTTQAPTSSELTTDTPRETTGEDTQGTLNTAGIDSGMNSVVPIVLSSVIGSFVFMVVTMSAVVVVCCMISCVLHRMRAKELDRRHRFPTCNKESENRLDYNPISPEHPPYFFTCKEINADNQSLFASLFKEEDSTSSLVNSTNVSSIVDDEGMILSRFLDQYDRGSWRSSSETFSQPPEPVRSQKDFTTNQNDESAITDTPQDDAHSYSEPPAHLQIDHEFFQLVKNAPVAAHPPGYKHSAGSSGYGTESETYYASSSTTPYSCTNEYFKSREAELSDALPMCEEESEGEGEGENGEEDEVQVCNTLNGKTILCPQVSSDSDKTQAYNNNSESVNMFGSTHSLPALTCDQTRSGHTCEELDKSHRLTPLSIPPDNYYTDLEGYIVLTSCEQRDRELTSH